MRLIIAEICVVYFIAVWLLGFSYLILRHANMLNLIFRIGLTVDSAKTNTEDFKKKNALIIKMVRYNLVYGLPLCALILLVCVFL